MLLTIRQFHALQESEKCRTMLHDISKPIILEEDESYFLGYVPVVWDNGLEDCIEDAEEADDYREVDIVGVMSEGEALRRLEDVFGEHVEIERRR